MAYIQDAFFIAQPVIGSPEVLVRADVSTANISGVSISLAKTGDNSGASIWMPFEVAEKVAQCIQTVIENEK